MWELPSTKQQLQKLHHGDTAVGAGGGEHTLLSFNDDGRDLADLPSAEPRVISVENVFTVGDYLCYTQRTSRGHSEFAWHQITRPRGENREDNPNRRLEIGPRHVITAAKLREVCDLDKEEYSAAWSAASAAVARNVHLRDNAVVEPLQEFPLPLHARAIEPTTPGSATVRLSLAPIAAAPVSFDLRLDSGECTNADTPTGEGGRGQVAKRIERGNNVDDGNNEPVVCGRVWIRAPRNVPSQAAISGDNGHGTITGAGTLFVPVSIAFRPGLARLDGSSPAVVRVYGNYGLENPLSNSAADRSLLDRGVIVAHVHVRGGGELGTFWHDEGRQFLKRNAVTDLHACLETLQGGPSAPTLNDGAGSDTEPVGIVARGRVALQATSAGAVVAAAVVNAAPALVRAVVLEAPFLDLLNSMLDPDIPLVVGERGEWCDPLESQECYFYLKSYCPYYNLQQGLTPPRILEAAHEESSGPFPDIFVKAFVNDARVMFWDPIKYVNVLRSATTGTNVSPNTVDGRGDDPAILLRMRRTADGGHAENHNFAEDTAERALLLAFILSRIA